MKSIANQYRDLKEGRMSQANFMRNLRMNMPQYITNVTSFNDAIRILKNKAILTESGHGDAPISQMSRKDMIDFLGTTEEKAKDMSDEELRDAVVDKNEDIKENDDAKIYEKKDQWELDFISDLKDNMVDPSQAEEILAKAKESMTDHGETLKGMYKMFARPFASRAFLSDFAPEQRKKEKIREESADDDAEIEDMIAKAEEEESGKYTKFQDVPGTISEAEEESPLVLDAKSLIPELNKLGFKVKLVTNKKEQPEVGKGNYCYIDVNDQYNRMEIGLDKQAPLFQEAGGGQKLQNLLKDKLSSKYDAKFITKANMFVVEITAKQTAEELNEEYDFPRGAEAMAELIARKYGSELKQLPSKEREKMALSHAYETILNSGHPKAKVIAKNVVWGYADEDWPMDFITTLNGILGRDNLKEGKGKDLHPNQIHPQELRMGIRVELEHTDDLDKAKKIALDHLAENPFYYTALKLSGIESPSKPKEKPVKEKKAKKSDKIELVDLVNGMKKVKMPKAEEKKKLKEARFNIAGEPNAAAEQAMKFVDGNATLKALSNDIEIQQSQDDAILRYDYWKPLPPEAVEKLKLQFDVELIEDFDEDTGNIIAYRLTPLRGKEEKYRAFQSKLKALVKEVMAEYYDGRDNLIDDIAATEK